MKTSPLLRGIAILVAVAALAFPSVAAADEPLLGDYVGDGVHFTVGNYMRGGVPQVESAYYNRQYFQPIAIHAGTFEGCTRVPVGGFSPWFRDNCIHGVFGAPGHASGTIKTYHVDQEGRSATPYATHHWKAVIR